MLYMLLWCCCDCHGMFCLVLWETMGMHPKCATYGRCQWNKMGQGIDMNRLDGSGQQLLWVAPAFRILVVPILDIPYYDSGHLSCAFMIFYALQNLVLSQLSLPKGLRPATSVNGSSFAAFPCASPRIRWRSCFESESSVAHAPLCSNMNQKKLDQIDSNLEIYIYI